jgi:hypothetical protein
MVQIELSPRNLICIRGVLCARTGVLSRPGSQSVPVCVRYLGVGTCLLVIGAYLVITKNMGCIKRDAKMMGKRFIYTEAD